ncbi:MAG: signal peptide peptidase SppA [Candidatus Wolframiiraptor sp. EX4484-121]|nr:MAG: signal peptide peptidase SppA [Candidatus Wolframiiraptor sp. EX4484-121]
MKELFRKTWFIVLVTAIITAGAVSGIWLAVSRMSAPTYGGYVAVIKLSGNIAYQKSPISILGATLTPEDVEELVREVEADPYAKAIVLYINSPGGSASASEEIYNILRRLSEARPMVAYISEYGTSGGYYISLAADEIIASPTSVTGSIGAVSIYVNVEGFAEKLGLRYEIFKSGRLKDIGSPLRELTDEERRVLQSMVNSTAKVFLERVREVRGDKIRDWSEILTARPYLGLEARRLGLVDDVGDLEKAISEARRLAGLPETAPYRWVKPKPPSLLDLLLGGESMRPLGVSFELLYMWPPPPLRPFLEEVKSPS